LHDIHVVLTYSDYPKCSFPHGAKRTDNKPYRKAYNSLRHNHTGDMF